MGRSKRNDQERQETLQELWEAIQDKKGAALQEPLERLHKYLTLHYAPVELQDLSDSLIAFLTNLVRRSGHLEIACSLLAFVWITLGSQTTYESLASILEKKIRDDDSESRHALVTTLAVISFIQELSDQEIGDINRTFISVLDTRVNDSRAILGTLSSIGLLHSKRLSNLEDEDLSLILDKHLSLLESSDVDVRIAAGRNVALFLEFIEVCDFNVYLYEQDRDKFYYSNMEQLLESIEILASDSTKSRAKADRATQRAAFRDIIASIRDREPPRLQISIRNLDICFDSWTKIIQWNVLKAVIGQGTDVYFAESELLANIFDISLQDIGLNPRENLRLYDSTVGKARARNRRQDRDRTLFDDWQDEED